MSNFEQEIRDYFKVPSFKLSDLNIPETCPYCGTPLEIHPESNVHIWCPNLTCSRKLYGFLLKFCNKLGVTSLGKVSLQALAESGSVKSLEDFLSLSSETFKSAIPRTGDKAYSSYQSSIANLQGNKFKLATLLASLNIPHCGEGVWEMILSAPVFTSTSDSDTLFNLLSGDFSSWSAKLSEVPRLSERAIVTSFKYRNFITATMKMLFSHNIQVKVLSASGSLSGKKFCQTGGLTRVNPTSGKRLTRTDLISIIEANGGSWSDTIDKLTYLIIDDIESTSSKAVKARKCGATLLSENDFFSML